MANELSAEDQADIEEAKAAYQAYVAHTQQKAPAPSQHPIRDAAMTGVHAVGAGIDWMGGNIRNAAAQGSDLKQALLDKLEGREHKDLFTRPGDTIRALKGNAPKGGEYLERVGVPQMGQLSDVVPGYGEPGQSGMFRPEKGGALDPSVRGTIGAGIDVATDPLTYLSGGLSAVAKGGEIPAALKAILLANEQGLNTGGKVANAVLNPVEALSRRGSKSAYRGAFGAVDKAAGKIQNSGESVAELAQKHGFVGNADQAAQFVENLNAKAGQEIGRILDEASSRGATLDLDVALKKAEKRAAELRSSGHLEDISVADMIDKRASELRAAHGNVSVTPELTQPQQTFGQTNANLPVEMEPLATSQHELPFPENSTQAAPQVVPKETIDFNKPVNVANKLKSKMNNDAKFKLTSEDTLKGRSIKAITTPMSEDIGDAVGSVDQELKKALLENNARYHSTNDDVQYLMESWAGRTPQLRNPLTPTKVDLLALGIKPGTNLLKKVGDVVLSTRGRTATGFALDKIGQNSSGRTDELARQLFWDKLLKQKEDENGKK